MTEYIVNFGDDKSSAFVRLAMAEVACHGAKLREEIVRCRDCRFSHEDELGNLRCHGPLTEPWDYYNDEPSDGVKVKPDGFCKWAERKENSKMSMCYLCDMCKLSGYADEPLAVYPTWECWGDCEPKPLVKFAIDYGRDDPHEICEHFEPKEGGE